MKCGLSIHIITLKIHQYTYIHTYIHTFIHSIDPQDCHKTMGCGTCHNHKNIQNLQFKITI